MNQKHTTTEAQHPVTISPPDKSGDAILDFSIVLTFAGGLLAGFILAYFKYLFDAEKSRFDFRTKILREVWETVLFAKSLSVNLDPKLGESAEGETREQWVSKRLEEYSEAYVKAKRIVRFNEPFYPKTIHDLANELLLEAHMNAKLVGSASPDRLNDYWQRIKDYKTKMDSLSDQLCEAIRKDANRPSLNLFKQ